MYILDFKKIIFFNEYSRFSENEYLFWMNTLDSKKWIILLNIHMGREHAPREKKLSMVIFLIFVQKNVSTIRFQEIKIRPWKGFEKMRFLCFYIIGV